MAITDNIVYRLKPESGDSSPHNEIGGGDILSGGTISLQDRGGGDYAWQFSGADSIATGISKTITPGASGGGMTMAITLKVVTNPSGGTGFNRYVQMHNNSNANVYCGLTENGTNAIRGRYASSSGAMTTAVTGTVGSTEYTYVLRISTNSGSNEVLDIWRKTTGRVGTAADYTSNSATLSSTLDRLLIGGQNSQVLQVKDWVIWSDEKTDAECAAGADDLRGQLDASGGVVISCTVGDAVAAGSTATITNGAGAVVINCTVGNAAAAGSTASVIRRIVTEPLINNSGTVLAAEDVSYSWLPAGRIGSLDSVTAVDGTGTTRADGSFAPGIARADGILMVAQLNADATDDAVYYEAFSES